jgi:hypothetical protein
MLECEELVQVRVTDIVAKKLLTCRLDLVEVLEVGLDEGSTEGAEEFSLFDGKGN